jgi:hypothetical protein
MANTATRGSLALWFSAKLAAWAFQYVVVILSDIENYIRKFAKSARPGLLTAVNVRGLTFLTGGGQAEG